MTWLNDPKAARNEWSSDRWHAFRSRCQAERHFDAEKDGELVAAERLGQRERTWEQVWNRFAEAPALYPEIPAKLRKAMPGDLFVEPSSWPQRNESEENALRQALLALGGKGAAEARAGILELEKQHGQRRDWVWAKLRQAPLAEALFHLSELAAHAGSEPGGGTPAEMAEWYSSTGWKVDAAALDSMAAVTSSGDTGAVSQALNAVYRNWLDSGARHLQTLIDEQPLTGLQGQDLADVKMEPGGVILFADGLRFDVAQRLIEGLQENGRTPLCRRVGQPSPR